MIDGRGRRALALKQVVVLRPRRIEEICTITQQVCKDLPSGGEAWASPRKHVFVRHVCAEDRSLLASAPLACRYRLRQRAPSVSCTLGCNRVYGL